MDGFPEEYLLFQFTIFIWDNQRPLSYPSLSEIIQSRLIFPVQVVHHGLQNHLSDSNPNKTLPQILHDVICDIFIVFNIYNTIFILTLPGSRIPQIFCWYRRPCYTQKYKYILFLRAILYINYLIGLCQGLCPLMLNTILQAMMTLDWIWSRKLSSWNSTFCWIFYQDFMWGKTFS